MKHILLMDIGLVVASASAGAFEQADLDWLLAEGRCKDCDLRGASLHGADLAGARLAKSKMSWSDLKDANLRGADLTGADLASRISRRLISATRGSSRRFFAAPISKK